MAILPKPESPGVLARIYRLYRDYFDMAEKKRRWSLRDDIPWAVKELRIFDYDIFYAQVFEPILTALQVDKSELRRHSPRKVVAVGTSS
jgi:hypothetical protein